MLRALLVLALFLSALSMGADGELKSFNDLLPLLKPGTLLIVDLDNTLIEPTTEFGTEKWYEAMVHQIQSSEKVSKAVAEKKAMALWEQAANQIQVRPVEASTPALLTRAQNQGIPIMGLTARPASMARRTHEQLKEAGIDLKDPFSQKQPWSEKRSEGVLYENGILFVDETNSKGERLVQFFKRFGYHPNNVIFVDDKVSHVKSVEEWLGKYGVAYQGFHYTAKMNCEPLLELVR